MTAHPSWETVRGTFFDAIVRGPFEVGQRDRLCSTINRAVTIARTTLVADADERKISDNFCGSTLPRDRLRYYVALAALVEIACARLPRATRHERYHELREVFDNRLDRAAGIAARIGS